MLNKLRNKLSHAIIGIRYTFRTQSSFKIQILIAIFVLLSSIFTNINNIIITTLFIIFIFSLELINTAIEKICDYIQPNLDPKIKIIKDISAGAVLISCFGLFLWEIYLLHYYFFPK
jgi:diacylglycerol kinase